MPHLGSGSFDGGLEEDDGLQEDGGLPEDDGLSEDNGGLPEDNGGLPEDSGGLPEAPGNRYTVEFPGAAQVLGYGKNAVDLFDEDQFSDLRKFNLFYPWASKGEWEVAQYLLKSSLSLADIDVFLKLELVCSRASQSQIS